MNSDLQVVIGGNTAQLQAAIDEAIAGLKELGDAYGMTADDAEASGAIQQETADKTAAVTDETSAAGAAARDASGGFGMFSGSLIKTLAPLAALFAGYEGLKAIFEDSKKETDAVNNANAQLANTLKNGAGVTGITVQQVDDLAESTAKNTAITRAATLAADAQLANAKLTPAVYKQAAESIDDIGTAMANARGQTVPSSQQMAQAAKLLGTALQDPAKGVSALKRAGIELTGAQQDEIKALDKAGETTQAQTMLMNDFAEVTKGKAVTATETFSGKVQEVKNNLIEFTSKGMKEAQNVLEALGEDFVKILPKIDEIIEQVVKYLKPAFEGLFAQLKQDKPTLEVIGQILLVVAKVAGGVLVVALKGLIEALTFVLRIINDVSKFLLEHKAILDIVKVAVVALGAAFLVMNAPVVAVIAVLGLLIAKFSDIKQWIADVVNWIKSHWELLVEIFLAPIAPVIAVFLRFHDQIIHVIGDVINGIKGAFSGAINWLVSAGENIVEGLIHGIEGAAGKVFDTVKSIGSKAVSALKGVLKIFSPSQVFADIGTNIGAGLVQGIAGTADDVAKSTSSLASAAVGGVQVPTQTLQAAGAASPAGQQGGAGVNIYVAGNLMQLSGQDATDMMAIIGRNAELTGLGLTPLLPNTGGAA